MLYVKQFTPNPCQEEEIEVFSTERSLVPSITFSDSEFVL